MIMEFTALKRPDLRVSRLGFGCCPMGGHGWGATDDAEMIAAVHEALDRDIRLFDTADIYGLGRSEQVLGRALGERRGRAVVASKFGVRRTAAGKTWYDTSPRWIVAALEASLERLNTDYLDLYQMHYWDGVTPLADVFDTLENLRAAGKIRYYGVSNLDPREAGAGVAPEGLVSFSYEFSLAQRRFEPLIRELALDQGLGFLSWGSLGQGILAGRYDESSAFGEDDRRGSDRYVNFHGEKLKQNLRVVEALRKVQRAHPERTLAQLAIRWILDHLGLGVVLVGIKRPEQLRDNAGAFGWRLSAEEVALLDEVSR